MNFRLLSTENHRLFYPDTRATTPHGATQWHVLHHGIGVTAGERQHNSVGLISTTVATKKSGSTNLQNVRHCSIISHYKWASSSPASLLCLFFRDMGGGGTLGVSHIAVMWLDWYAIIQISPREKDTTWAFCFTSPRNHVGQRLAALQRWKQVISVPMFVWTRIHRKPIPFFCD